MLQVGDKIPPFELLCSDGTTVSNTSLKGRWTLLFFYPKDMTPGCTTECKDYSALVANAHAAGLALYGVSKDALATHTKFIAKEGLRVPLLADPDKTMHLAFGAWGEKLMYGKRVEGTIRSTFIVGPDAKIAHVWPKVSVAGHADAAFARLRELAGSK